MNKSIIPSVKMLLQIFLSLGIVLYFISLTVFLITLHNGSEIENTEISVTEFVVQPVSHDSERMQLEQEINSIISGETGIWSVYIKNLNTGMELVINNRETVAASLIKLFNMVTLYDEIYKGNVVMTDSLDKSLRLMITESSNSGSNKVVETIGNGNFAKGAEKVTALAQELGCTYTLEQHKLYDDYAPSIGKNRTSVKDCGLILEKIYFQNCTTPKYDKEMLELLKQQQWDWKLPKGIPHNALIAHKTGENSRVEADVGIVFSPKCDYIICVSVMEYGTKKTHQVFADISGCVYKYFNEQKGEII